MDKVEKLIYSVKYLPPLLYFGSVGLIVYDIYCNVIKDTEFLNEYTGFNTNLHSIAEDIMNSHDSNFKR